MRRAKLPQFQSDNMTFQQMQNQWGSILDPVVAHPLLGGYILNGVTLQAGANPINHKLGKPLTGWYIVRLRGPASIYDTQDTNSTPAVTLDLVSSALVNCDIYVF